MPVYKYKSFRNERNALLVYKPDENYYKMLSGFYEKFGMIFTKKFTHGVYRFKNIRDAQNKKTTGY
jgi:hypothetical protein